MHVTILFFFRLLSFINKSFLFIDKYIIQWYKDLAVGFKKAPLAAKQFRQKTTKDDLIKLVSRWEIQALRQFLETSLENLRILKIFFLEISWRSQKKKKIPLKSQNCEHWYHRLTLFSACK